MSRRRRPPHDDSTWLIKVVCTDRGEHQEVRLGLLSWWPGGVMKDELLGDVSAEPHLIERGGRGLRPDERGRPRKTRVPSATRDVTESGERRQVLDYRCPVCERHVPWRWETASRYVEQAYKEGVSRLDISNVC